MQHISLNEAETNLSQLIDQAANGEPFVISKSGKPLVTVQAYAPAVESTTRIGFLQGMIAVPDDFDAMGQDEIATLFGGAE